MNPGDRARLSGALDELLSRPTLIKAQGATNRSTVARRYTMEMVERSLKNGYRELASGTEYFHEVHDGDSHPDSQPSAAPVEPSSRRVAGP